MPANLGHNPGKEKVKSRRPREGRSGIRCAFDRCCSSVA
ncbi:hypothetical protein J2W91_003076 [Paenibacillus amylolyticus]|uniref:Uncharacterized protein n=1 Tax=Paenibacillus amylolyticus TaxID=1451 RepID=A0AAP5LPK2_PAEAM|nr:hypothetical protein [Paenibacillus amylolyticus]